LQSWRPVRRVAELGSFGGRWNEESVNDVPVSREFRCLCGESLDAVTFVHDYIQLQFASAQLNALTCMDITCGDLHATSGSAGFADLLVAQIGKVVRDVELNAALVLIFDDGSRISISIRAEDYTGPEAINLFRAGQSIVVV
jgi:hypothetical protein